MSDDRRRDDGAIEPGHIWLIEERAATSLSGRASGAVASAEVVIYDRALTPLVMEQLPLGSYAEPWSPDPGTAEPAPAARALKFAAEGWRVVQLVKARPQRRAGSRGPAATNGTDAPPNGAIGEPGEADPPTLVFGPFGAHRPVVDGAFTANGLAG